MEAEGYALAAGEQPVEWDLARRETARACDHDLPAQHAGGTGPGLGLRPAQGRHHDHPVGLARPQPGGAGPQYKTAIAVSTMPTQLQRQAFDLLGVDPNQTVPITVTGSRTQPNRKHPVKTTVCVTTTA